MAFEEISPASDTVEEFNMKGENSRGCANHSRKCWLITCGVLLAIAIGLGVGLGVGLTQGGGSGPPSASSTPAPSLPTSNTTTGSYFRPTAGTTWQIVLPYALNDTSSPASVYDIDLFLNPTSTITNLHALNKSVICYFSAGSYENFRNDSNLFKAADYGNPLDGWPGEYWLNTNSTNVRNIMLSRLALAKEIGCDGVDPDNVDGYDNDTGFSLTTSDAVNYMTFLATSAHNLGLAIGLKNAGTIVSQVVGMMQWEVNEQCVQYSECDAFQPFIEAGKPVFHVEYPSSAPSISATTKAKYCNDTTAVGFSSILKNLNLDDWIETC